MQSFLYRRMVMALTVFIGAPIFWSQPSDAATGLHMPASEQNVLIQRYCAVCHTDAARNGGLSLQHFDAARVDPSLAAMLVSKLKSGAFGAAGLPLPDKPTMAAFTDSLTAEAVGAEQWTVVEEGSAKQPVLSASILRALPSARVGTEPALYRLVLACNAATHQSTMRLSWSPAPKTGSLSASFDGNERIMFKVEGRERMGNGTAAITGPAAFDFPGGTRLPLHTLTVGELFPDESVSFSFDNLPQRTRDGLLACFPPN